MDTKTLLIVDDLPANVDVVLGFLSGAGYRVLVPERAYRYYPARLDDAGNGRD